MTHESEVIAARERRGYRRVLAVLAAASVVALLYAIAAGRYFVPVRDVVRILLNRLVPQTPDWDGKAENIIFTLRIPRAIGAFLVGGALSLSGVTYQGVFKNPLVSPDLLGISSGACVGAASAILLGLTTWSVQVAAFAS